MEGTIAIQEKRSVVDKFKSWYKEKMIDNGRSAKLEEVTDKGMDFARDAEKLLIVVGGVVVGVLLAPESVGLSVVLSGLLISAGPKIADIKWSLMKRASLSGKRATEGLLLGVDGTSENVNIPDLDLTAEAQDIAKDVLKEVPDIIAATKTGTSTPDIPTETSSMKM